MIWEQLSNRPFCIYGAGIVAMSVYTAIEALYDRRPLFFLISDSEVLETEQVQSSGDKFKKTNGIPIKKISEWKMELQEYKLHSREQQSLESLDPESNITIPELYFVAAPEIHHASIRKSLQELRIKDENIFLVTNRRENDLMETYYSSLGSCRTVRSILLLNGTAQSPANGNVYFDGIENNVTGEKSKEFNWDNRFHEEGGICVYQAKSHMDKPLHRQYVLSEMPSYIFPIQVGSALTDQTICDMQDNTGDNISAKNRNYCELTATYYVWKHSNAPYKGVCHYRRIFDMNDEQMYDLLKLANNWDVILPYPSVHYPDLSMQHTRYVREDDWNAMLQALRELEPEYLETYEKCILTGEKFFHNFNMLIAKAAVFDDYCSFLFRILARAEELTTPKGWERADRFAGYLGENLTTIYFLKNRVKWKIAYAGKIWLV